MEEVAGSLARDARDDDEHDSKERVLFKYFLKEWELVKSLLDCITANGGVTDPSDVQKIRSIVRFALCVFPLISLNVGTSTNYKFAAHEEMKETSVPLWCLQDSVLLVS